ncbi:helix-turn-helix domain-containing protein [Saccharibacillus alkalitolerans]|uniref:Helix-turn-helix transcriptional regulator n=1 Tax=Saccharibacillus alkalitolerans TaxID=2705290 RepID=A0ABX0F1L4_9BACL|nr:helix-turn-helix domain-containing protein [Saccharibacillus alkalitolerans]NGZ74308.1 helix-turn-helix transcriptional regulator [Saccharibacillus alkalitolerans]
MKKGRMFYKTFIPILLLGVGLAVSFGIYTYIQTVRSVIDSVAEEKQNSITQIKNNLEQKIRTIEYAFNTYSTTSSFREAVDRPITERDFQAYREVNSQLNYIATMGLEGAEYTLISLNRDWRISNGTLSHIDAEEKERLYGQYIENREKGLFWIRTESGIRFVNTLPAFSRQKEAIALSDISLATLNRTLRTEDGARVFILNKQGDLMYDTGSGPHAPALDETRRTGLARAAGDGEAGGMLDWEAEGQSQGRLIYSRSAYNNWTYFTVLDQGEIAGALKGTRLGLIAMELALILLIAVVAYWIAGHFTKPIRQITRSLPAQSSLPVKNEIDWILSSINRLLSEKQSLESLMEAEKPQLETQFVLNLFRSRIAAGELKHQLHRLGYDGGESRRYVTMLVQLDNVGKRDTPDRDVLLLAVNKIAEEIVPARERMLPVILNDSTQATLLMFDEADDPEIRRKMLKYAKEIVRAVKEYLKLSVSVGISRAYPQLLKSREACEMSKQALHQRLNLGKESIIFYEDITGLVSGPVLLHYPAELESKLFDAIRLGDEQRVAAALYPLLAEFMKKSRNSMNLEVMLIRLVNNLIQLEQLLGIEVLMTADNHELYHRLLSIRNPEEVERVLVEQVIFPMVRSMEKKTNEQFRCLSQKIADIVREEYDRELSLEMIGERLHYNPNYLSSIFKKEFGVTFSDYLMGYRLDMAKKWLTETDQTVKEIAERLQYHNPQNFIRSFRKKEQVTPGVYRKLRQNM